MNKPPANVSEWLAEIGAKGGAAGKGKARGFATLKPAERRELARNAALAKWKKARKGKAA